MNTLYVHYKMMSTKILLTGLFSAFAACCHAQQVPVLNYSIDINGQAHLEVNSTSDNYYLLRVKHHPDSTFTITSSMTLGQDGTTVITEALGAYPVEHYEVLEYSVNTPGDADGDGVDDLTEYNQMPLIGPLNAAESIPVEHGLVTLNTLLAFQAISTEDNGTPWVEYLNDVEYTKFLIDDFFSDQPKIYFINSETYNLHGPFADYMGIDQFASDVIRGQLIYNPHALADNGSLGTYAFNFSNNEEKTFAIIQRTQELVAANMPFLANNLSYFVTENNEDAYQADILLYQDSRVPVLFESDVYAGIDYWGLNQAEGYGFFRLMGPGDVPDPKDIVLYEAIPNSLPRVGGVISSFIQTPLSHVNLRAIHDNIPNAFIRDPLLIDTIANLLNHYIYFRADQSSYVIREATIEEVNAWYENLRPAEAQLPPLNLTYQEILPLSDITFEMYDGFGAKVANVATMRTFGFAEGTIPDGFGIPFYFYQEFMKHNGFMEDIAAMLQDPAFISDRLYRDAKLAELREAIEDAEMPAWMMDQLSALQLSFPAGSSIRCRSSTNNEDLPGFSGAGLYDSKTHHPDEDHISKSVKQIYASLWNLRAFEAREFYRINHFATSMGILVHRNFDGEKVNGVGVSADPLYSTSQTFYLNSQLGEALITNPEGTYPEELLIDRAPGENPYLVIHYSSLVPEDSLLMTDAQLDLLRQYLAVIHDQFAILYNAVGNSTFAMDIEYKIDHNDQLIIKQARPWVSFMPTPLNPVIYHDCGFVLFPNPSADVINIVCDDAEIVTIRITDMRGSIVLEQKANLSASRGAQVDVSHLPEGTYVVSGVIVGTVCGSVKFVKL